MPGQPWRLRPSTARFVTSPRIGYASRPNRVIDGIGLSPTRFAALPAATGNNSPFATAFTTHVETPALSQLSLAQGAGRRAGRNPPAAGALCLWLSSGRAI